MNLSQGLVSISSAVTSDSDKVKEVYDRNSDQIEMYRVPPLENATTKVFNIFWQSHVCGQIVLQIKNQEGLISYWVDSQLSNRNIATNAVILLKHYAFDVFDLSAICAYVQPKNLKSIRVLEKSGFYKTESVFTPTNPTNTGQEHYIYRIERDYLS